MKSIFKKGDSIMVEKVVTEKDVAHFELEKVHDVYSTFALARDAEWACRQFVLQMKEHDEEGIGTMVSVYHLYPAYVGQLIKFTATVKSLSGNEIICSYEAHVGNKLVAKGEQGQKILKKERLRKLMNKGDG